MDSALIVSRTEKSFEFFTQMLDSVRCEEIVTVNSCGEARRLMLGRDFDLCIINAPLSDESGESLSRHVAARGICQVLLLVGAQYFEEMSAHVEDAGVITLSKPLHKDLFWSALKLARAAHIKMRGLQSENTKLIRRIEDIRIVDRAKCLLISYLGMTEAQAHKYIEKQAMDTRMTKRAVAEDILKTYEY